MSDTRVYQKGLPEVLGRDQDKTMRDGNGPDQECAEGRKTTPKAGGQAEPLG